jgi:hypothetical protein
MTPDEIVAQCDVENRRAIKAAGGVDSEVMMDMLNAASMRGFTLGQNVAISILQGALAVKLASIDKRGGERG